MKSKYRAVEEDEIQQALGLICPVSRETARKLSEATQLQVFRKDDFLEQQGQLIEFQFIVSKGVVRSFLVDTYGNELTIGFYTTGMAITPTLMRSVDFLSFVNLQIASREAEVYVFSNRIMDATMKDDEDLMTFGFKVMMADSYMRAQRERMLLTFSGMERLKWFRQMFPGLENEVPHYYIASYLGLTPTTFSRLRAK